MPMQPEYATYFDKNLQRNVIQIRCNNTDTFKQYVYDEKIQGLIEAPKLVKISDLIPFYMSKCKRHNEIFFCKNLIKDGNIFKYLFDHNQKKFFRIQCTCCDYDPKMNGTYFCHDGTVSKGNFCILTHMMNATLSPYKTLKYEELVDEDSQNFLWIRPTHSDICHKTNDVVVFAVEYPEEDTLKPYKFDSINQKFVPAPCNCTKCSDIDHEYNSFEHGTQGIGYRRTHRDRNGIPLVCLSMKWHSTAHGSMEVFCDEQGFIGKYEWNEDQNCFDMKEYLDVRVHRHQEDLMKKRPDLLFDDGLKVLYGQHCTELGREIFFGYHIDVHTRQKFTFNAHSHQFEIISCSDCQFDSRRIQNSSEPQEISQYSLITHGAIKLKTEKYRSIRKEIEAKDGSYVVGDKAPIRYLTHLNIEQLIEHFTPKIRYFGNRPVQILESNGSEKWIVSRFLSKNMVYLFGMNGEVRLHKMSGHYMKFALNTFIPVDVHGEELKLNKTINVPTSGFLTSPSDRNLHRPIDTLRNIVHHYTFCPHFNRVMLFAECGGYPIQFLLTPDYLIHVECKSCEPKLNSHESRTMYNKAIFAHEDGYMYQMDFQQKGTVVQKMEYDVVLKTWKLIKELSIRLLMTWKGEQILHSTVSKPQKKKFDESCGCCGPRQSLTELVKMAIESSYTRYYDEEMEQISQKDVDRTRMENKVENEESIGEAEQKDEDGILSICTAIEPTVFESDGSDIEDGTEECSESASDDDSVYSTTSDFDDTSDFTDSFSTAPEDNDDGLVDDVVVDDEDSVSDWKVTTSDIQSAEKEQCEHDIKSENHDVGTSKASCIKEESNDSETEPNASKNSDDKNDDVDFTATALEPNEVAELTKKISEIDYDSILISEQSEEKDAESSVVNECDCDDKEEENSDEEEEENADEEEEEDSDEEEEEHADEEEEEDSKETEDDDSDEETEEVDSNIEDESEEESENDSDHEKEEQPVNPVENRINTAILLNDVPNVFEEKTRKQGIFDSFPIENIDDEDVIEPVKKKEFVDLSVNIRPIFHKEDEYLSDVPLDDDDDDDEETDVSVESSVQSDFSYLEDGEGVESHEFYQPCRIS